MDYILKRLDENDLSFMRSLNQLFGDVFEDPESYHKNQPTDDYLVEFLHDQKHVVLVAVDNDEILGGLVAFVLTKCEMQRSEVYLYDLAVATKYQGKGIGSALIKQLQKTAKDIGAYVVFVQADEGDRAVDFYRSLSPDEEIQARSFDFKSD